MPLNPNDLTFVREVIRRRTGNVWSESQGYLIESRLTDIAKESGYSSIEQLVAELKRSPMMTEAKVAEAVVVNETRFYRDIDLFQALETSILPEVIENRRREKKLTIWSGACSTGQEPYSIAMMIAEKFPELMSWSVSIIACDINDKVLEKTKSATYSQFEVNRGLPVRMLAKYFERSGMDWKVVDSVRKMVQCRKHNLLNPISTFGIDIALLRNVLIYFDADNKRDIVTRVLRATKPDGFLILGGGETLLGVDVPCKSDTRGTVTTYRPLSGVPTPNMAPKASPATSTSAAGARPSFPPSPFPPTTPPSGVSRFR